MASRVKRNKTKFKWTVPFSILAVFILALIVSAIVLAQPSEATKIYNAYQSTATDTSTTVLSQNHVFKKISYNSLVKKIKNTDEVFYVYYGSETCSNCVSNVETFNQAAQSFEIDRVFYLNSSLLSKYDLEDDDDLSEIEALGVKLGGVDLLNTPSLLVYKNGEVVFDSGIYEIDDTEEMSLSWKAIAYKAFGTEF